MHKTRNLDDGYMGSGKMIHRAIQKDGIENFIKEILYVFDEEWKMKLAEKILVVTDPEVSYNLCPGGLGGWGYINKTIMTLEKRLEISRIGGLTQHINPIILGRKISKGLRKSEKFRNAMNIRKENHPNAFYGKEHSDETKQLMSLKATERLKDSTKNSQYGTRWIFSLEEKTNRKISKDEPLPEGWFEGRKMKF